MVVVKYLDPVSIISGVVTHIQKQDHTLHCFLIQLQTAVHWLEPKDCYW